MSDELQILTTNAASDGWVDGVPGAVSTGYQAQNTVLQALFNGLDKSSVRIDGANLKIDPSGVIDDSGLPFVVQSAITLALPTTGAANWFLKVVAGSTALERSIEFTDDRGAYDASKNGFYNTGGERVLNWVYDRYESTCKRIVGEVGDRANDITESLANFVDLQISAYGSVWRYIAKSITTNNHHAYAFYGEYIYDMTDANSLSYIVYRQNRKTLSGGGIFFNGTLADFVTADFDVDPTTGNLIRTDATNVHIQNGISATVGSTISLATAAIAVDQSGNLIARINNTSVGIYAGISATLDTTITVASKTITGVTCDRINSRIFILGTDENDRVTLFCHDYSGNFLFSTNAPVTGVIAYDFVSGVLYITGAAYNYSMGYLWR